MYRFMEPKSDENINADMARFYALLGEYAERTKACFMLVHHSTKGNQSEKRVTDVGSGAGSQSRAADAHLVFREHADGEAMVWTPKCGASRPSSPWLFDSTGHYGNWRTTSTRRNWQTGKTVKQKANDEAGINQIVEVLGEGPATRAGNRESGR